MRDIDSARYSGQREHKEVVAGTRAQLRRQPDEGRPGAGAHRYVLAAVDGVGHRKAGHWGAEVDLPQHGPGVVVEGSESSVDVTPKTSPPPVATSDIVAARCSYFQVISPVSAEIACTVPTWSVPGAIWGRHEERVVAAGLPRGQHPRAGIAQRVVHRVR